MPKRKENLSLFDRHKTKFIVGGIILLIICVLVLIFYRDIDERIIGEWEYNKDPSSYEGGWGDIYSYKFESNGTFRYWECLHWELLESSCANGSFVWYGRYSTDGNNVKLYDMAIDTKDSYNPTSNLKGPAESLIVNYDYMYMCNADAGYNCIKKFKKRVNE